MLYVGWLESSVEPGAIHLGGPGFFMLLAFAAAMIGRSALTRRALLRQCPRDASGALRGVWFVRADTAGISVGIENVQAIFHCWSIIDRVECGPTEIVFHIGRHNMVVRKLDEDASAFETFSRHVTSVMPRT